MTAEDIRSLTQLPLDALLRTARTSARTGREMARTLNANGASSANHMASVIDALCEKLQPMVAQEKNAAALHASLQEKVQPKNNDIPIDDAGLNK